MAPTAKPAKLVRGTFLGAADDAHVDLRRVCNGIKRTSQLAVAGQVTGADTELLLELTEALATKVLTTLGYERSDTTPLGGVLAMVMEPVATIVADAVMGGATQADIESETGPLLQGITVLAKAKWLGRALEAKWPADMHAVSALRITTIGAVSNVATEAATFDFFHDPEEGLVHAGKVIVGAALAAAEDLSPPAANEASRMMLLQSLLGASGRIYAASWRACATPVVASLKGIADAGQRRAFAEQMAGQSIESVLGPVDVAFHRIFQATKAAVIAVEPAPKAAQSVASPRFARFRAGAAK